MEISTKRAMEVRLTMLFNKRRGRRQLVGNQMVLDSQSQANASGTNQFIAQACASHEVLNLKISERMASGSARSVCHRAKFQNAHLAKISRADIGNASHVVKERKKERNITALLSLKTDIEEGGRKQPSARAWLQDGRLEAGHPLHC